MASLVPGNPPGVLVASEAVALTSTVAYGFLGSQAPQGTRLPPPRELVAILGLYAILGLIGSFGALLERAAAVVGGVTALTLLVVGARGQGMVLLLRKFASLLANPGQ